jgi:dTDP-4-amino-4,6-dideoxygalactose transaminase
MPLYKHPVFDETPDTTVAKSIWEEIVTSPMSSTFDEDDIIRIVDTVRNYSRVEQVGRVGK